MKREEKRAIVNVLDNFSSGFKGRKSITKVFRFESVISGRK
jgi:hypothetical protein